MLKNITLLLVLLMTGISCSKTIGTIDIDSKKKSTNDTITDAVVTPQALQSFSCATSTTDHGVIDCTLGFPADTNGYRKVMVMRTSGTFSSPSTCDEGIEVLNITNLSTTSFSDLTESEVGEAYSYRACVVDSNGEVSSFATSASINAFDLNAPANLDFWSCTPGTNHGEIDCTIDFPTNTRDYSALSLRQISGETSPNSDCTSDGSEVLNVTGTFTDQIVTLNTGSSTGESFSYRFCITDTTGNLNSSITVSNVQAKDTVAPPALDNFICGPDATKAGSITCTIDYPVVVTDYYRLDIRRLPGATAPNADCSSDGQVVFSETSSFLDDIIDNKISDHASTNFSYRACVYDSSGLLESSATQTNITGRTTLFDSFSCVTGNTTTGNIDCSVDFPTDTSRFSRVTIRRILGTTAPNSDCRSDGEEVHDFNGVYNDVTITDATGSASGTAYSYRICATSNNGRPLSNDQAASNILSF